MQQHYPERLHEGDFYRLKRPVGPIPAGIYRLEEADDLCWQFSVGTSRRIRFLVMFGVSNMLRRVPRKTALTKGMRETVFAEHYYRQLKLSAGKQVKPRLSDPISACMMPAEYEIQYDGPFAGKYLELERKLN